MAWTIEFYDAFYEEFQILSHVVQDELLKHLLALEHSIVSRARDRFGTSLCQIDSLSATAIGPRPPSSAPLREQKHAHFAGASQVALRCLKLILKFFTPYGPAALRVFRFSK